LQLVLDKRNDELQSLGLSPQTPNAVLFLGYYFAGTLHDGLAYWCAL
jgi:hypothetical protein